MRRALIVCGVFAARAAYADPRAMAVALGPSADGWTQTLVPADGAQFPAVSADGRVIVELFHDRADFVGQPLATVVFFSRGQRAASIALASDATPVANRAQALRERRALAAINARLSRARWQPLAIATPSPRGRDERSLTDLGDGVHVELYAHGDVLVDGGSRTNPRTIPLPRGSCAQVDDVDRAFGSRAIGFVVVVPRLDADGEVCVGPPIADLAIAVLVP